MWPEKCTNNRYSGMNKFKCVVCHPDQPIYTDVEKKVVRVCESLLRDVYGAELNEKTKRYEECGAWADPDTELVPIDPNSYLVSTPENYLIFPYEAYNNANEFFENFGAMSIPFLSGWTIQSVPDIDEVT